ncbi:hypothetical protein Rsub_05824 [Raphidocelis subcapitata]|uniref:Uncharacterized protein n=1 Tax=Raphidocelis subcapitata TaxID=307507 RepID=A0A2V0NZC4_9CHLO|nr:hypothetical protein Rsub_05824 [Raphidocelis subcapitata]|eukprot:GBF92988.1 hypothetical protein Rsub_05824 [Raphidocelis subcapitata]
MQAVEKPRGGARPSAPIGPSSGSDGPSGLQSLYDGNALHLASMLFGSGSLDALGAGRFGAPATSGRPGPGAKGTLKAEITRLCNVIAAKRGEAGALLASNMALRVRCAALHLMSRAVTEIIEHRAACGGGAGGAEAPSAAGGGVDFVELAALQAGVTEAGAALSGDMLEGAGEVELLRGLPHLAPDASILHIENVSPADVDSVRKLDMAQVQRLWKGLVEEALVALIPGSSSLQALTDVGVRMSRFHGILSVWNWMMYMGYQTTHMTTGEATYALDDAPLSHWERVIRAARLTRLQGMLYVDMYRIYSGRVGVLYTEMASLLEQLRAGHTAAAENQAAAAAAAAAGLGGGGGVPPLHSADVLTAQFALLERLDACVRAEQAALTVTSMAVRALFSPAQWARTMAIAYPYPGHLRLCCEVLEAALRLSPEFFVD